MVGHTFTIRVKLYRNPTTYRMQVEITYVSDQVLRFTISAGDKAIDMEKLLVRKSNKWKVKRVHFASNYSLESQAEGAMKIQDEIDDYLKQNFPNGVK